MPARTDASNRQAASNRVDSSNRAEWSPTVWKLLQEDADELLTENSETLYLDIQRSDLP